MSKTAYFDPDDFSTSITADEYARLPRWNRRAIFCGAKNGYSEICQCRMHFVSASSTTGAYFAADNATDHIMGCPNCRISLHRTVLCSLEGEKASIHNLLSKFSKPPRETTSAAAPSKCKDSTDPTEAADTAIDESEEVRQVKRLPRNAVELYSVLKEITYDDSLPDAQLLIEETILYHALDDLEGDYLFVGNKYHTVSEGLFFYKFPFCNSKNHLYGPGPFTLLLALDGAPDVLIRLNFKYKNSYNYIPKSGTRMPQIFTDAIKLKNIWTTDDSAKLVQKPPQNSSYFSKYSPCFETTQTLRLLSVSAFYRQTTRTSNPACLRSSRSLPFTTRLPSPLDFVTQD